MVFIQCHALLLVLTVVTPAVSAFVINPVVPGYRVSSRTPFASSVGAQHVAGSKLFSDDNVAVAATANEEESAELETETSTDDENTPAAPEPFVGKEVAVEATSAAEEFTAYIVNLPYGIDEESLKQACEPFGTVTKVFIPTDRRSGRARGFAFVSMSSQEELDSVITSVNATQMDGRTVYVSKAEARRERDGRKEAGGASKRNASPQGREGTKLYVGNLSFDTTGDELMTYFNEFGRVKDVYVPTDQSTGEPRGFAFVNMHSDDAEKAIAATDGVEFQGRNLAVNISLPRGTKSTKKSKDEMKLYVGNISFDTDEDTIRQLFGEYGEVVDMYMPIDRATNRPRGFAFVTMPPEAARRAADETDGYELDGRVIRVNEAQPKGYSSTPRYDEGNEENGATTTEGDWGVGDESWGN